MCVYGLRKTIIMGIELQCYPFCINQRQREVFFSLPHARSLIYSVINGGADQIYNTYSLLRIYCVRASYQTNEFVDINILNYLPKYLLPHIFCTSETRYCVPAVFTLLRVGAAGRDNATTTRTTQGVPSSDYPLRYLLRYFNFF